MNFKEFYLEWIFNLVPINKKKKWQYIKYLFRLYLLSPLIFCLYIDFDVHEFEISNFFLRGNTFPPPPVLFRCIAWKEINQTEGK